MPGKCSVHEFFPWGSSWLACLCDQGCSKGVRLFPAVLKAAGKRLCGLQCCIVIFCYPATGCTQLKDPAGGHRRMVTRLYEMGIAVLLSCGL